MKNKVPRKERQVKKEGYVSSTARDLIKRTAATSAYSITEVEDIYRHLIGNIQLILAEGIDLKLSGLGTFRRFRHKPRKFYSPLKDKEYLTFTSDRVKFTPDLSLQNVMKKARTRAVDVISYLEWLRELTLKGELNVIDLDRAKMYYVDQGLVTVEQVTNI